MAPHSSTLAWQIPWTEEPGGLQSMGSLALLLFTFMHWRRQWQPTPVFLPGESQGRESLVGCCLWGRTESDTIEAIQQQQQQHCRLLIHQSLSCLPCFKVFCFCEHCCIYFLVHTCKNFSMIVNQKQSLCVFRFKG